MLPATFLISAMNLSASGSTRVSTMRTPSSPTENAAFTTPPTARYTLPWTGHTLTSTLSALGATASALPLILPREPHRAGKTPATITVATPARATDRTISCPVHLLTTLSLPSSRSRHTEDNQAQPDSERIRRQEGERTVAYCSLLARGARDNRGTRGRHPDRLHELGQRRFGAAAHRLEWAGCASSRTPRGTCWCPAGGAARRPWRAALPRRAGTGTAPWSGSTRA